MLRNATLQSVKGESEHQQLSSPLCGQDRVSSKNFVTMKGLLPSTATVLHLTIRTTAGCKVANLSPLEEGMEKEGGKPLFVARVKAPAEGGKANAELRNMIAVHYGVRVEQVTVARGEKSRTKHVVVTLPTTERQGHF